MPIQSEELDYADGASRLRGVLFRDPSWTARPGALVFHGGAGLDAHARAQAERIAKLGIVTFACDMYGEGVAGDRARVMSELNSLRTDRDKLVRRASAALEVLRTRSDRRICAVGYCFGGLCALEFARAGAKLLGAVSVHGSLGASTPARRGELKGKLLVCHGALDPHISLDQVKAFMDEMNAAEADWQLLVLGGAQHGFTHEGGAAMPGVAFHAYADARSFQAMQSFFDEIFGPRS